MLLPARPLPAQWTRNFVATLLASVLCCCLAFAGQQPEASDTPRILEQKFEFPPPIQWKLTTTIPGNPYIEVSVVGLIWGPVNSPDILSKATHERVQGKPEFFSDRPYALGVQLRAVLAKPLATRTTSGLVRIKNASGSLEYPPELTATGFVEPPIVPAGVLDLHWAAGADTVEVWDLFPVTLEQKEFLFQVIPPPSSKGSTGLSFRVLVKGNGFEVAKASPEAEELAQAFTGNYSGNIGPGRHLYLQLSISSAGLSGFAPFAYKDKAALFKGKKDSLGNFKLNEYFPGNQLVGILDGKFSQDYRQMSGYYSKPDGSGLEPFELQQTDLPGLPGFSAPGVPPCPTENTPAGWKTYVNEKYRFCFSYPPNYTPIAEPWLEKYTHDPECSREIFEAAEAGRALRLQDTQHPDACLCVTVGTDGWDLQAMTKYAPTGLESPPEPKIIAGQVFYYYGPGGGGVCYPDQFFYDLRGKPLSISFCGPCVDDKTPTAETKKIEDQVLATFQTY